MNRPAAFEWDEEKAGSNLAKHGVSFDAAYRVFADPNRLDEVDARIDYGEERRNAIGQVNGIVLSVAYTMRGEVARIISARRASRKERRTYGDRTKDLG